MKSAYELAMERLQKESPSAPPLTDEQKAALAEIDNKTTARIAEKRILAEQEMSQAGDVETLQKIQDRLQEDIRRLETEREEQKAEIRKSEQKKA